MNISGQHINTSVSVGDLLYCTCMSQIDDTWVNNSQPILFGVVTDVGGSVGDGNIGFEYTPYGVGTPDTIACVGNRYIAAAKDKAVNESSLKGYYNLVSFLNDDNSGEAELFVVNSEVAPSSK